MGLLLIVFLVCFACQQGEKSPSLIPENEISEIIDSLKITINLPGKNEVLFSTTDSFLNINTIHFENKTESPKKISKTVPRSLELMVLNATRFHFDGEKFEKIEQLYLIDKNTNSLELKLDTSNYRLSNHKSSIDDLYHDYRKLGKTMRTSERADQELRSKLDSIHDYYNQKYINNNHLIDINKIHYHNLLLSLSPKNEKTIAFLKSYEPNLAYTYLQILLYNYVQANLDSFNYKLLENSPQNYLKLLSLGHFAFLSNQENKGDDKYQFAVDWLKSTDFYKKDSLYIRKEIEPLDNTIFKSLLGKITFIDKANRENSLKEIIRRNPSEYYLIDFWATWCAPCIDGVRRMNNMSLPKNLKVISLSVDAKKDFKKWVSKTQDLNQKISYWIDDESTNVRDFVEFIGMQSIPRYLIINNNMNLIDEAFLHPSHPQFLFKLSSSLYESKIQK